MFPFRVTPALPPSRPSLAQDEGDNMSQATSKASRGNRRLDSMRHVSAQRALPSGSPSGRKSWSRLDGPGDTPEETPRVEQGEPGSPATAGIGPEASPRLFMTGKRSTSVQTVTMVTKSLFFFERKSNPPCVAELAQVDLLGAPQRTLGRNISSFISGWAAALPGVQRSLFAAHPTTNRCPPPHILQQQVLQHTVY